MAVTASEVATQAGAEMRVDPADAKLVSCSAACIDAVARFAGLTVADLPDKDADASTFRGLVLLAQRMYIDTPTPSGGLDVTGDLQFTGATVPADLLSHLRNYFEHLSVEWGVS